MTIYELIFVLLFLGSVISLPVSPILRRRGSARKLFVTLASVWGVYIVMLALTDVFSRQRVFKNGEEQCFDEMCFAVVGAHTMPAQTVDASVPVGSRLYVVEVRATSRSRGRAHAEGGLRGRLYDGKTYIDVSEAAQKAYDAQHGENPKLTQRVGPGEHILSALVFEVPQGITHPALTLDHGFTPGYFVIGESPFFHKPDVHQLAEE